MAFLIPDNIKSRKDVPSAIQRVAKALEIALDDTATLWFEPLFDPSKQKPHYVLLLPDRGVVVMEVLEAKSSGILGSVRGKLRLMRDATEVEVDNPLDRAERFAAILRQRIGAEPRIQQLRFPVEACAVLASLTREEATSAKLDRVLKLDRCLFKQDIEAAIAGGGEAAILRRLVSVLNGNYIDRISDEFEKVMRGLIQPDAVIDAIGEPADAGVQVAIFRPPAGEEEIVRVMDRQQEAMAKSLGDGHRVIRGVAGSGKTLILVYRAKLLAQAFPQHRFLVACYNRSLAGELRVLLADFPNITVWNLDSLMAAVIRAARLQFPGYEADGSGERVAERALEALASYRGERYRAVLLDEAQDFGTSALRFALGLLQNGSDDFIIVADSAQNIYKRRFSWKSAGIQAQGRTRILRVNYRNTRQILEFASAFLLAGGDVEVDDSPSPESENAVIPPDSTKRSGPPPALRVCGAPDEEANSVVEMVQRWAKLSAGPRSIGVLYGTSRSSSAESVLEALRRTGIDVYWLSDPKNKDAKDHLSAASSPVVFSTIHSAKGLEFPCVVLCSLWNDRAERAENRKLAYVGMTRASQELAVVTTRSNPLASDLLQAVRAAQ